MAAQVTRWVTGVLATALTLGAVAWSVGIYQILALTIYEEQFAAAMLAACLGLTFLHLPARRETRRARVPWYDWVAAAAGFAAAGYIAVYYPAIVDLILLRPPDAVIALTVEHQVLVEENAVANVPCGGEAGVVDVVDVVAADGVPAGVGTPAPSAGLVVAAVRQ